MNPNDMISNVNYFNDPRVRNAGQNSIPTLSGCATCFEPEGCCDCSDEQYGSGQIELPWKWSVCPTCNGKGRHVNPSIDCNGLTSEDFEADPDFLDEYFNGQYDQQCSQCNGRTTVPAVDWDAMSPELRQAYQSQLDEDADYRACCLAEIRAGC